jgi:hypothetical protein
MTPASGCLLCGRRVDQRVDERGQLPKLLYVGGTEQSEIVPACLGQGDAHDAAVVAVGAVAGDKAELLGAIDELHCAVVPGA